MAPIYPNQIEQILINQLNIRNPAGRRVQYPVLNGATPRPHASIGTGARPFQWTGTGAALPPWIGTGAYPWRHNHGASIQTGNVVTQAKEVLGDDPILLSVNITQVNGDGTSEPSSPTTLDDSTDDTTSSNTQLTFTFSDGTTQQVVVPTVDTVELLETRIQALDDSVQLLRNGLNDQHDFLKSHAATLVGYVAELQSHVAAEEARFSNLNSKISDIDKRV
jgi:hypothetical protein